MQAGIRVLPGFGRDLKRGRTAGVQVLIEGTNSNTASLVASYASQIINAYSAAIDGGSDEHAAIGALNERAK